jgi:cytochrome P450
MLNGNSHHWNNELHLKYGSVVRYAPNNLSYTDERAWKEIHGFKKPSPFKDPEAYGLPPNQVPGLLSAPDEQHARMRRVFAHAFSDKALKEQEPLFVQYIDVLVSKLKEMSKAEPNESIDIVRWLNFTTFDIMGDLTFGEPLGLLEKSDYTPWAALIFQVLRAGTYIRVLKMSPIFNRILKVWIPSGLKKKRDEHFNFSIDRVNKRLDTKTERPDIWGLVLRQQELGRGLSLDEMHSNAGLFMGAGTETTATELSGLLYYLLSNPDKMATLVKEIRTAFPTEEEMSMERIAKLKYLHACLEEGLRMYPPVPIGLPRVVPGKGTKICDEFIPGGVSLALRSTTPHQSNITTS